jgi:putative heme-binding domain-containing protein
MKHRSEYVRGWAVWLALERRKPSLQIFQTALMLAEGDPSPFVRLYLAAVLPRFAMTESPLLASRLVSLKADRDDFYLPYLYWYGIESIVAAYPKQCITILERTQIPLIRNHFGRRIAAQSHSQSSDEEILKLVLSIKDPEVQHEVLEGVRAGVADRPRSNYQVDLHVPNSDIRALQQNYVIFCEVKFLMGSDGAQSELIDFAKSGRGYSEVRQRIAETLLLRPNEQVLEVFYRLLDDESAMTRVGLRGLAAFSDKEIPTRILARYTLFSELERMDAVQTLASRPSYVMALLDAIEKGEVARQDVSPFIARQILSMKNAAITEKLTKVWGTIRPVSKDRPALMTKYKAVLSLDDLKKADPKKGKLVFANTCASCHKLFGEGASIGPDLTGSQRSNLDYILENVLDPSAVVAREYQVVIVELKSGRTLNGIIARETEQSVTVQTQNEAIIVAKKEIESRTQTNVSMMPEGLLDKLSSEQVRNLVAYLMGPAKK